MAVVLLKTTSGLNVKVGSKELKLKGFGLLNDIPNDLWNEAKKNSTIQDMLEKGYIVEGGASDNAKSDAISEAGKKQNAKKDPQIKVEGGASDNAK